MSGEVAIALIGVVGTLAGGAMGAAGAWLAANRTNQVTERVSKENARFQDRNSIDGLLFKMIELSMQYPSLEKEEYCQAYPNCTGHPNGKERYESFCIFAFNLLERIYNHFDGDPTKIGEYIHLEEMVRLHCKWWLHDKDNLSYSQPFRTYVQSVIDKLRVEGRLQ